MGNKISVLDCTLRDGGYINSFDFGVKSIKNILCKLTKAHIDIVEVGFLKECEYNRDFSIFSSVQQISNILSDCRGDRLYVAMIAYGEIDIKTICNKQEGLLDGIRVTFHKPDLEEALVFCKKIKEKGYKIFIQPVGINSYSDIELINLIEKVNLIEPYAFYIVDTLGILNKKSITYLFGILDNNLKKSINIGYHSHNNLQLAFSNAQEIIEWATNRSIIIDASVFGMGRGAGNLCTELLTSYLNNNYSNRYITGCILEIIDEEILKIFSTTPWGYNTPYYLSATHRCHPNYATFLLSKQTLPAMAISKILTSIRNEKKDLYDKNYIESLYISFLSSEIDDSASLTRLKEIINNRAVLILGAGMSVANEQKLIADYVRKFHPFVISVNFIDPVLDQQSKIVFFSNSKKYLAVESELSTSDKTILATSNIISQINSNKLIAINYSSLLLTNPAVFDNAGLMLINLLHILGIKEVILAGFDGFNNSATDYIQHHLFFHLEREGFIEEKNAAMKDEIGRFRKEMSIKFLTRSLYE